jgi:hypothetical protein
MHRCSCVMPHQFIVAVLHVIRWTNGSGPVEPLALLRVMSVILETEELIRSSLLGKLSGVLSLSSVKPM